MTLAERLARAQVKSTGLYLERQDVEMTRQQAMLRAQQIDRELLTLDGEIAVLEALIKESV